MAYQSLARKYRPSNFNELEGQATTVTSLLNAIEMKREPHAVVFSGIRGVGKTTLARLYAKALNCEKGPSSKPCGICESCRAISIGNHEDVLEIDGASNTGVDDVRELKDMLSYAPQRSTFKVFIIDEVHMLSQSAFNALLKILEEPPSHVIFVFATTEIQKIPQTIISRCQVFRLNKLTSEQIKKRLCEVLDTEGLAYDEDACRIIAKYGHGSMRDALTLLDQAVSLMPERLNAKVLSEFLNFVETEELCNFIDSLVEKNAGNVLKILNNVTSSGIKISDLIESILQTISQLMILKVYGTSHLEVQKLDLSPSEIQSLFQLSAKTTIQEWNRLFRCIYTSSKSIDGSSLDKLFLENILIEWCFDEGIPTLDELKNLMQNPNPAIVKNPGPSSFKSNPNQNSETTKLSSDQSLAKGHLATAQKTPHEAPKTLPNIGFPVDWKSLVDYLRKSKALLARILEEVIVDQYTLEKIELSIAENSLAGAKLLNKENQEKLKGTFKELFGFSGELFIRSLKKTDIVTKPTQPANSSDKTSNFNAPQGSLLEKKQEALQQKQKEAIDSLRNSALTVEMLSVFGAKIESETLKNP